MPTTFTHPAVTLLITWFPRVPSRVVIAGIFAAILPDIDVLAFRFGIPYGATFGHRGFTHSIVFALAIALIGTIIVRPRSPAVFAFLFLCAMSHAVLDSMTNGGLGVAFFSPFSNERYFLPWRPIRVSPIGPSFFSPRGLATLTSEVVWVWIPCVVAALLGKYVTQRKGEAGKER